MMQLQKDAPTLTDKQKQTREQSLMQQQANFQKEVASLQQEEQAKEQEAATAFQRDVKSAIEKIGKKKVMIWFLIHKQCHITSQGLTYHMK